MTDFILDYEKMADFIAMNKDEFLLLYSYLSVAEYDATARRLEREKMLFNNSWLSKKAVMFFDQFLSYYGVYELRNLSSDEINRARRDFLTNVINGDIPSDVCEYLQDATLYIDNTYDRFNYYELIKNIIVLASLARDRVNA